MCALCQKRTFAAGEGYFAARFFRRYLRAALKIFTELMLAARKKQR
jgi:hypothetical protein